MPKRKKHKSIFQSLFSKRKTGAKKSGTNWLFAIKILIIVIVIAAIATGFVYLKKYVLPYKQLETVSVELLDVPIWVSRSLEKKLCNIITENNTAIIITEDTARQTQFEISSRFAWLNNVKVRTTMDTITINGDWRKPLALVKKGVKKFHLDREMIILDYADLTSIPVVLVIGFNWPNSDMPAGEALGAEDIKAAVDLLDKLDMMDSMLCAEKPLLNQIDRIDVSNFNGRLNKNHPHLVLYAKDNTEIIWGAELGMWQRHFEATDKEKLAQLYNLYKQFGTLTGNMKYINLRDPQGSVSEPVDKYK